VLFRADAGRPKIQCSRHLDLLHHVRAVCPHSSGSQKRAVANQIILLIKDQFNSLDAHFEARRLLSLQPKQRVGQRSKLPQPADAQALANQLSMMKQAQTYLAAQLTSSLGTSHLLLRSPEKRHERYNITQFSGKFRHLQRQHHTCRVFPMHTSDCFMGTGSWVFMLYCWVCHQQV